MPNTATCCHRLSQNATDCRRLSFSHFAFFTLSHLQSFTLLLVFHFHSFILSNSHIFPHSQFYYFTILLFHTSTVTISLSHINSHIFIFSLHFHTLVWSGLPQTTTDCHCHWLIGSIPLNTQTYFRGYYILYMTRNRMRVAIESGKGMKVKVLK